MHGKHEGLIYFVHINKENSVPLKCISSIFQSQQVHKHIKLLLFVHHFNSKFNSNYLRLNTAGKSRAADKSRKRLHAAENFQAALQLHQAGACSRGPKGKVR